MFQRLTDRTDHLITTFVLADGKETLKTIKSDIKRWGYVYGNAGVGKLPCKETGSKENLSISLVAPV